jgi:hypothetical protein
MNSLCAVVERDLVVADDAIDWESPAGPSEIEGERPRLTLPEFFFVGPGDRHWIGQRCDVLGTPPGDPSAQLVRLACGCRAEVPSAWLRRLSESVA